VWVWVFLGIAAAGLVMLICYAVWLAHLTADVLGEVAMLGERAGELADLLGEIGAPDDQHRDVDGRPVPGRRH